MLRKEEHELHCLAKFFYPCERVKEAVAGHTFWTQFSYC